jgi:hypothetical protein
MKLNRRQIIDQYQEAKKKYDEEMKRKAYKVTFTYEITTTAYTFAKSKKEARDMIFMRNFDVTLDELTLNDKLENDFNVLNESTTLVDPSHEDYDFLESYDVNDTDEATKVSPDATKARKSEGKGTSA